MEKIKIFLDTDIGDDIDDALAVALLMNSPEAELAGVTTVMRDTLSRAREVKKLLSLKGINAPVFAGCMQPFEGAREGKILLGGETDGFAADNERDFRGGDSAVEFLLETVKKYPNEIVLVGIGPLTNIARAILKDRAAMEKVKKIIIMGGNYFHSKLEWNILSDSAAAKIVFESGLPLFCVGTDVTEKVKLNNARQKILFAAEDPVGRRIARYAAEWIEKRGADITLHDPLAVYAAIRPDFLHFAKQRVFVVCGDKPANGYTLNLSLNGYYKNSSFGGEVSVADYVCAEEVLSDFMRRVFGA